MQNEGSLHNGNYWWIMEMEIIRRKINSARKKGMKRGSGDHFFCYTFLNSLIVQSKIKDRFIMEIIRWKINSAHKKGTKNYF
jgi:hypothetical protein